MTVEFRADSDPEAGWIAMFAINRAALIHACPWASSTVEDMVPDCFADVPVWLLAPAWLEEIVVIIGRPQGPTLAAIWAQAPRWWHEQFGRGVMPHAKGH